MTTKSVTKSLPKTLGSRRASLATPQAPKKAANFHSIFMKESESLMTINDNGQRRRISKLEAIAKQLHNKALTGNIQAMRIYVALYPQLREMAALQSKDLERTHASQFTDEELEKIIVDALKKKERERKK
jgi:hypothetical protein